MTIQRKRVAKRLASGLLAGAVAFGGLALSGASPAGAVPVDLDADQRLGGADRYATAALVTEQLDEDAGGVTTLIIANGENFPDALAATSLSDSGAAPILLVGSASIPSVSRDRMFRLADTVADVYVIGGTSAVSADVFTEIEEIFEDSDVTRIAGDTRYATAAAVADELGYTGTVVLTSGTTFADSVTVGPWASANAVPVLLANSSGLPSETAAALEAALDDGDVSRVIIIGGPAAVGSGVEEELVEMGFAPADISRVAGADRYQTNLLWNLEQFGDATSKHLADAENDDLNGVSMTLVSGANFPDALAAAPLAAANNSHLVLVDPATGGSALLTLGGAATVSTVIDSSHPVLGALTAVTGALTDGEALLALIGQGGTHVLQDLWVVGGTSAVPASTISTLETVAGGGDVNCAVIAGGGSLTTGPDSFLIAFSGDLQTSQAGSDDEEDLLTTAATLVEYIEIDGESVVSGATDVAAVAPVDLNENGFTDAVAVVLGTSLDDMIAGTEVSFLGLEADVADYAVGVGTLLRDFGACSTTVARDRTAPTAAVTAVEGSEYTYVKFSEPLDGSATAALVTAIDTGMGGGASNTCTSLDTSNHDEYICVETTVPAVTWADGETIDIASATYTDEAGNSAAGDTVDVIATSDYAPGISAASKTCAKVGAGEAQAAVWVNEYASGMSDDTDLVYTTGEIDIEVTGGNITLTAGSGLSGVTANDWNVVVTQSRGVLRPTVTVDGTTMTIAIDRYVHTAADIVRAIDSTSIGEGGLSSSWDASTDDADGLVSSALIDDELNTDNSGTLATTTCKWSITLDTAMFDSLSAVTSSPSSNGEFRITVAGDPVDVEALDGADTEYQYDEDADGGVRIEGVMSLTEDGILRVEVFVGGELVRLTV